MRHSMYMYIYIYIYTRETERERESERYVCVCVYIYIYIYVRILSSILIQTTDSIYVCRLSTYTYILSANILSSRVETLIFIYYLTVFHKTDYTKIHFLRVLSCIKSHYYYKLTIKNFKEVKL